MAAQLIAIIEDDPVLRHLLREVLELEGYRVMTASNGRQALRQLAHTTPDLIITDIYMPEQDGIEVIMALRRQPGDPKIIAISGDFLQGTMSVLDMAAKLGAHRTIQKPFSMSELVTTVKELLDANNGHHASSDRSTPYR
jgi:CheY-like chemotaxis protein